MGERIDLLEAEVGEMKVTLQTLADQMIQQGVILGELSKQLGKRSTSSSTPGREDSVGSDFLNDSRLFGKKVKLPVFEGEDPVAWIKRVEIYFDVQNTSEEIKVKLARLSMEGSTIHWFNLLLETEDELSWVKLKKALIARYGGRRLKNPFEELSTLRQKGGVEEYVESYLRCFASEQPKSWSHWIPWAEFWYNSTYHISIGRTPFEVVYGRQAPNLRRFLSNETKVAAVATELSDRDEALSQLKQHLLRAQQQMKKYADLSRRDVKFDIGEWVFLKLRPHKQHSVIRRIHQKLAARFYGPFQILDKIGEVAYKLKLPDESKIHSVFHVSLLKRAVGNYKVQGILPKDLEVSTEDDHYPAQVLGTRVTVREGVAIPQSLIQWKHKSRDDVTWEDNDVMRGQFPDFILEDKDIPQEGGIDRKGVAEKQEMGLNFGPKPKIWRVYARRNKGDNNS